MSWLETLKALPPILAWRRARFERYFATASNVNAYYGVFDTWELARASAPQTKPIGYDNPDSAELHRDAVTPLASDYPAMHWLARAFADGATQVLDIGGHLGQKYYAFRDRLPLPPDARWTVFDVPAVADAGAALARTRDSARQLDFRTSVPSSLAHTVVFASGSVQYLPQGLAATLATAAPRPARIVVNTAALHPTRTFYTLNSIGTAFCPYRVQHEAAFVSELAALGYVVDDRWETPKPFRVAFEPSVALDRFVGLALRLT
ncbi:MAG: methyltransferase, TIGR04325 family [Gemmatimonadaceae bacterium]|nr:methyltransferase, TIGR04325 family [Gemmatimonadaceae bacterium]